MYQNLTLDAYYFDDDPLTSPVNNTAHDYTVNTHANTQSKITKQDLNFDLSDSNLNAQQKQTMKQYTQSKITKQKILILILVIQISMHNKSKQ